MRENDMSTLLHIISSSSFAQKRRKIFVKIPKVEITCLIRFPAIYVIGIQ